MENSPFIFSSSPAARGMSDKPQNAIKPESLAADPISVLIIEDEEAHFQLMKRAIRKELPEASVCHRPNAAACLEELTRINPDIILVDYLMPGMNGIEFLAAVKQAGSEIPVIMITGQGDERIAVQAMKLGAQDYLVKSADFFLLLPAVIGQAARERRLKNHLRKVARLNELLLDSLPYPAMMIRRDRFVLAANRISQKMGARVGAYCWQNFRLGEDSSCQQNFAHECPFCRANDTFELEKAINAPEIDVNGRIWDMWWIPVDRDVCLTYAIDITERKKAEEALRRSELIFRRLAEANLVGVGFGDAKGNATYLNDEMLRMMGYTRADYEAGRINWIECVAPEDRENHRRLMEILMRDGQISGYEHSFLRPDGGRTPYFGAAALVKPGDDFHVSIALDLTHIRTVEDKLKSSLLSLKEKEVLLQEIHHRVKNNMQVVRSLLSLQAANLPDEALKHPFEEACGRIDSMAMIHEALYQSESFSEVDLRAYVEKMVASIRQLHRGTSAQVTFEIDVKQIFLSMVQSVPCGLILNELVTNAFKHAFPHKAAGKIEIKASVTPDGQIEFRVSDNGVGLPADFDLRNLKTLGMRLICGLAESQLGGTLCIERGAGSRFIVKFPLSTTR